MSRPLFDREVTHEQARTALHAFIATQTRSTTDRHARMSIPAQADDDDLVLGDYIRQQEAHDAAPETDAVSALLEAVARFVSFMVMVEASKELDGETLTGGEIVTHFMGNGASDALRVSDFWDLRKALVAYVAQHPTGATS